MTPTEVKLLLEKYELKPTKKRGQNFLVDASFIRRIVSSLGTLQGRRVLEVGPGLGALTRQLLDEGACVDAVEIDSGIVRLLREELRHENLNLYHEDFLKFRTDASYEIAVSNMPYYCASDILFRLAEDFKVPLIAVMTQKEMARRIVAEAGSAQYGAMTVTLQALYDSRIHFDIPAGVFYPRPGVISSFLIMRRKDLAVDSDVFQAFQLAVKASFWGRRKTLSRALRDNPHRPFSAEETGHIFHESGVDPSRRGETLSVDEFIALGRAIKECEL